MRGNLLILFVCGLLISSTSHSSAQPTFDCAKTVNADEQIICKSDDLTRRDQLDDQAFSKFIQQPKMAKFAKGAHDKFIEARRKCGFEVACIQREQDAFPVLLAKIADAKSQPAGGESAAPSSGKDNNLFEQPSDPQSKGAKLPSDPQSKDVKFPDDPQPKGVKLPSDPQSKEDKTPTMQSGEADGVSKINIVLWGGAIFVVVISVVVGSNFLVRKILAAARLRARGVIQEKRGSSRRATESRAGALFDINGARLTACTVIDRSATGARIRPTHSIGDVQIVRFRDDANDVTVVSKIVWRKGSECGIMFIEG